MDTSEQYIKMCDCEEIQEGRPENEGDFFAQDGDPQYVETYCSCWSQEFSIDLKKTDIWLPRQDQLQEMVIDADYAMSYLTRIMDWAGITLAKYLLQFTSMEQLWLAFVMKEKYGKVWDGEKWTSC